MKRTTVVLTDENNDYLRHQKYKHNANTKTIVNKLLDECRKLKREFKEAKDDNN